MLFFQLLLLAGYVYSHAYVRFQVPARRHIHIALLAVAAATLPLAEPMPRLAALVAAIDALTPARRGRA